MKQKPFIEIVINKIPTDTTELWQMARELQSVMRELKKVKGRIFKLINESGHKDKKATQGVRKPALDKIQRKRIPPKGKTGGA